MTKEELKQAIIEALAEWHCWQSWNEAHAAIERLRKRNPAAANKAEAALAAAGERLLDEWFNQHYGRKSDHATQTRLEPTND